MKNIFKILTLALVLMSAESKAQSISDILNSDGVKGLVETVIGGQPVTPASVTGEWNYVKPAVKLDSDNFIASAASSAITSKVEKTMNTYCSKVGLVAGSFKIVINSDSTFAFYVAGRKISGTYTVDSENDVINLSFKALKSFNLITIKAHTFISNNSLALVFTADKLLTLVSSITDKSDNSSLGAIGSLLKNYDGVSMGFEFGKTPGTGATTTAPSSSSSTAGSVTNALKGLFGR